MQKERHEQGENKLGYAGLCKLLTEWRNSPPIAWLADAPVHPLQQSLKDLERAYTNFFAKRADFPRFKKKGPKNSLRYPDPKQIKLDQINSRLFLPKLGWLRYRNSREVPGTVKNITVSQSCGKWFVSIQTERQIDEQPTAQGAAVGRDAGKKRSGQVWPEQVHPRSGLVRVPSPTGLQAGVARRLADCRAAAKYQPHVPVLRPCVGGQPPDAGAVQVCGMWF
ncbi:hypothetical protein NRB16_13175 [Pseudomonas sp. LJDD11]|uniref:RNA-guided endonuclease InsQ/TnpB family protein n=1 Tax=Pseudomonas sp. LJDD11 TaxID=2931984 RepID=UPI00211CEBA2|nr:hypothetical protein [Pseudomonas sp. LJDD11]MCQ9424469.1 hypothetical protein [Pseudomonas sp. LJDD11]